MYTTPKEPHLLLVPDYFSHFNCKMGECRHACCQGWPVTISMQNYFKLLGMECSKELRDRLDRSLLMLDRPTEDAYARFSHDYEGNCAIRMKDGRCPIHAHLGEDLLPDICRLYPRGFRFDEGKYEVSLSNSCEAVAEIFYQKKDVITFSEQSMTVALPKLGKRRSFFETLGKSREIRLFLISIIQNRNFRLPTRILQLGKALDSLEIILAEMDKSALTALLDKKATENFIDSASPSKEELAVGLTIAKSAVNILDRHSNSINEYGLRALAYFENGDDSMELYNKALTALNNGCPDIEIFFEHLLVNHMFFSVFPFQDRPDSLKMEFTTLCAVYTLLRFLVLGNCGTDFNKTVLIDTVSAFFRHVSHTDFERYASRLMYDCGCNAPDALTGLLKL